MITITCTVSQLTRIDVDQLEYDSDTSVQSITSPVDDGEESKSSKTPTTQESDSSGFKVRKNII